MYVVLLFVNIRTRSFLPVSVYIDAFIIFCVRHFYFAFNVNILSDCLHFQKSVHLTYTVPYMNWCNDTKITLIKTYICCIVPIYLLIRGPRCCRGYVVGFTVLCNRCKSWDFDSAAWRGLFDICLFVICDKSVVFSRQSM